jgi:hypothetical protein
MGGNHTELIYIQLQKVLFKIFSNVKNQLVRKSTEQNITRFLKSIWKFLLFLNRRLAYNGIWLNEGGIAHRQNLPLPFIAAFCFSQC